MERILTHPAFQKALEDVQSKLHVKQGKTTMGIEQEKPLYFLCSNV